jgi:hypothetical protein
LFIETTHTNRIIVPEIFLKKYSYNRLGQLKGNKEIIH